MALHGSNFLWVLATTERLLPVWYEGKWVMLGNDPAFFFCCFRCNPLYTALVALQPFIYCTCSIVACLRCFTEGPCSCSLVSSFRGHSRFLDSGLVSRARGLRAVWFFRPVSFLTRRISSLRLAACVRFGCQNLFNSSFLGHLACRQPAGFVTCMSNTRECFESLFVLFWMQLNQNWLEILGERATNRLYYLLSFDASSNIRGW